MSQEEEKEYCSQLKVFTKKIKHHEFKNYKCKITNEKCVGAIVKDITLGTPVMALKEFYDNHRAKKFCPAYNISNNLANKLK